MAKLFCILLAGWVFPFCLLAQPKQRLPLQLAMGFMEVVSELRLNMDSGLILSARSRGVSPLPVMAEDFEEDVPASSAGWINRDDPASGKRMLRSSSGLMHARLLLLLGAYYVFQPASYADSALVYLEQAERETAALHAKGWRQQAGCLLGKYYMERGDTAKAMRYFHAVIERAARSEDRKMEAKAWAYAGTYAPFSFATLGWRVGCLQRALELYRQDRQVENQIAVLQNIAYMSYAMKDILRSDEAARTALRLEDSIGFRFTHYTTDLLALLNHFRG
ncbi:MAG TPA: hypothetical protein VI233_10070, partial [Puia sp.]